MTPKESFLCLKRLLLDWNNKIERTELELLKPPLIRPSASFSPKEKGGNQLIASRQNNQIFK